MADSGTQELIGYKVDFDDGKVAVRLTVGKQHLNRADTLHGGITSTLLDVACGYEANGIYDPDQFKFLVTVSLTTNFIASAKLGNHLIATAHHVGGGRTMKYVQGELRTDDGKLIATASGIFRQMRTG